MTTHKLYNGDCLKVMPTLPENSVDLICTDPPYNISSDQKIFRRGGKFGIAQDINYDFGDWDYDAILPETWIPLVVKLLKSKGVFISFTGKRNAEQMMQCLEKEGMFIRHLGCWCKTNPAPQARKVKWMSGVELFVVATKNTGEGHHYNYQEGQHSDAIVGPICMGNERYKDAFFHPTQKPEYVIKDFIKWWSFPNDTILDPFMGTGTTIKVARDLNRNSIGIEKDEKYFNLVLERLGVKNRQLFNEHKYEVYR